VSPRAAAPAGDDQLPHRVACHLDRLLEERGLTLTELAERVGVSVVNLSVLKNDRARAVRFSTLTALCDVLDCQPGDLFEVPSRTRPDDSAPAGRSSRS
jgi:putative transcriptional regulator